MRASTAVLLLGSLVTAASCGGGKNNATGAAGTAGSAAGAGGSAAGNGAAGVDGGGAGHAAPDAATTEVAADVGPEASTDALTEAPPDAAAVTDTGPDGPPRSRYKAIAITSGRYHVCALLEDHRVKCWGSNSYGQLGLGDTKMRSFPNEMGDNLPTVDLGTGRTAKTITAGRYATCALLDDSSVKCWGWADLALGAQTPTPHDGQLGDEPGEMGDALLPMELGPGRSARSVTMGYYTACVVRDDESARCWGSSLPAHDRPAPTDGRHYAQLVGSRGVVARYDDGSLGVVSDAVVPAPPTGAPAGLKALTLAGSVREACALFVGNVVNCSETHAQGWPATFAGPVVELALTELGISCWRLADGRVQCRGAGATTPPWAVANGAGGDPFVRLGQPATALTSGGIDVVCALLANGEVRCWSAQSPTANAQGGSVATASDWPAVDLGTLPAP